MLPIVPKFCKWGYCVAVGVIGAIGVAGISGNGFGNWRKGGTEVELSVLLSDLVTTGSGDSGASEEIPGLDTDSMAADDVDSDSARLSLNSDGSVFGSATSSGSGLFEVFVSSSPPTEIGERTPKKTEVEVVVVVVVVVVAFSLDSGPGLGNENPVAVPKEDSVPVSAPVPPELCAPNEKPAELVPPKENDESLGVCTPKEMLVAELGGCTPKENDELLGVCTPNVESLGVGTPNEKPELAATKGFDESAGVCAPNEKPAEVVPPKENDESLGVCTP
jgi:hypothetical protein